MATIAEQKNQFDEIRLSWKVFRANKPAVAGLVIFLLFLGDAILVQVAPGVLGLQYTNDVIPPPLQDPAAGCYGVAPEPPSLAHPFGTTQYPFQGVGCLDLLQLVMKAIRIDLAISFFVVFAGAAIGTILGVVSGYAGKLIDEFLMRTTDVFFSIPFLILALAVGFIIGRTLLNMALALIVIWWPLYARYARSLTLSTKEMTFVEAARAAGSGRLKIMLTHVFPNVLPPILVQISLDVGTIMAVFATLAFIGFLPSNALVPELGILSFVGLDLMPLGYWWTVVVPGGVITVFALAMNLMGDGLRDVIDPRRRS
jgi:peptide/nickel transport system permease protein